MNAEFDSRAFRSALGCFATGVTIMTAAGADDLRVGMTVNSFAALSLDPPLVLWSIAKSAFSLPVFEAASHFAINMLADDQADVAGHFASRGIVDKFAGVAVRRGLGNAPLLGGLAATIECVQHQLVDGGDHLILIGRVERIAVSGKRPLVFCQGSYATAEALTVAPDATAAGPAKAAGFAESHLDYLLHRAAFDFREALEADPRLRRLSLGAGRLLAILGDQAAPATLARLASVTLAPEDETEATIADLVEWGLVDLTPSAEEVAAFSLSAKGSTQLRKLQADAVRVETEALAIFPAPDAQKFKTMLRALARHSADQAAQAAHKESADA